MAEKRDFDELLEKFRRHREVMVEELHKVIIGQDAVIDQILAAVFTGGHCLLVGVPGLAKTLIVSTIARILDEYAPSRAVFIDDLSQHHSSAREHAPDTHRLHLCGEPGLAPHIACGQKAGDAHARIDTWREALPWILDRLEEPA
mgnify:CR=1 FL=1